MNSPTNINKITAIIMIALGFSLLFTLGIAYQSYSNFQAIKDHSKNTTLNGMILRELNVSSTDHRLSMNNLTMQMIDLEKSINNTLDLIKKTSAK